MHADAGKQVKGEVTRIAAFGAFIRLEDGRTGLVHISEISNTYVTDVHDYLTVGQNVSPTIIGEDKKGRLAFSLKCNPPVPPQPALFTAVPQPGAFEEMLARYQSTSEDRIARFQKHKQTNKRKNR